MIRMSIIRVSQEDNQQTLGYGTIYDDLEKIFEFKTLELGWHNNEKFISCIPAGRYTTTAVDSDHFGTSISINNVPGRSLIRMHPGNYKHQIEGCVLPGHEFIDINNDGFTDVTSSRKTMERILKFIPDAGMKLTISWL